MIFELLFLASLAPIGSDVTNTPNSSIDDSTVHLAQSASMREARVEFRGTLHTLSLQGSCGAGEGGGYNTWASTLDNEGLTRPEAPRLHVFSSGTWSRIEFYLSEPPAEVSLYHDGDKMVQFLDGTYSYHGPVGEGSDETIRIDLACPSSSG